MLSEQNTHNENSPKGDDLNGSTELEREYEIVKRALEKMHIWFHTCESSTNNKNP